MSIADVAVLGVTLARWDRPPIDVGCPGAMLVVNGGAPVAASSVDLAALDVGDHRIEVRCPDATPVTRLLTVVEPTDERPQAPAAMNALLLLLCIAVLMGFMSPVARATHQRREVGA